MNVVDFEDELSVAQLKAIDMLLEGSQMDNIVKETGYSRTQIWRWRNKNQKFIAEWNKRKEEVSEFLKRSANKRFEKLQDTAIDVLEKLLKDSNNDNVKKEAATYIIERNIGKIPNKHEIKELESTDKEDNEDIFDDIDKWDDTKLHVVNSDIN